MLSFEILKVTILERVMLTLYGSLCLLDDIILLFFNKGYLYFKKC